MKTEFINGYRIMRVFIEPTDICINCSRTKHCPLISVLQDDIAALKRPSVRINECRMHKTKGA